MNYQYAYIILVIFLSIPWLIIYGSRKDLRKEMLSVGTILALAGFTEPLFYGNYWSPEFIHRLFRLNLGFESILLMFFLGGLAAVAYEFVLNRGLIKMKESPRVSMMSKVILVVVFVIMFVITGFLSSQSINVIYYSMFTLLMSGLIIISFRNDLIINSLASGAILAILGFVAIWFFNLAFPGIVAEWWNLEAISGILLIGVPLEEILWMFLLGFMVGPLYEMWKGLTTRRIS